MINLLRVKPCDIHWDSELDFEKLSEELFDKYNSVFTGNSLIEDLSYLQLNDFARLQLLILMGVDDIYNNYITISFDEVNKIGLIYINVSGLDTEDDESDVEKENIISDSQYFPIDKILLNNSLSDPLIHFDTKRNILSLPAKILLENKEYINTFGLENSLQPVSSDLDNLLSYNEDLKIYQYDLGDNKFDEYKTGWNYAASQDVYDDKEANYVYSEEGNNVGRVFDIVEINLDTLYVSEVDNENSEICLGTDMSIKEIFDVKNAKSSFALVYISEPTDSFALIFSDINDSSTTFLKISIKFKDFGPVSDRFVYCLENGCLYVPIMTLSVDIVHLLYHLGYGWDDKDISSFGLNPAVELTSEYITFILNRAIAQSSLDGDIMALNEMFESLESEANVNVRTINYEMIVNSLTSAFYKLKKLKLNDIEDINTDDILEDCLNISSEDNIEDIENEDIVDDTEDDFDILDDEFKITF